LYVVYDFIKNIVHIPVILLAVDDVNRSHTHTVVSYCRHRSIVLELSITLSYA